MNSRSRVVPVGLLAVVFALASASQAADADVLLSGPAPVRVWKDQAAMERGQDLLASGAGPDALTSLLACEIPPGTRASVTRADRSYAWNAEITEGTARGCRGVIGPRDFTTQAELARPPAKLPLDAPAPQGSPPAGGAPTDQPDSRMILWYQFYQVTHDGRTRTKWQPVAGWETSWQCDAARQRLVAADEEEVRDFIERFEIVSRASRGRITLAQMPREYGLDLEVNVLTTEGWRNGHIEVRSYCFPASHDPRR
jgi:hypothetical protein